MQEWLQEKRKFLVVDHIDGRSNDPTNLQSLCWYCNSSKAGKSQQAFEFSLMVKKFGNPVVLYPSLVKIFGLKPTLLLCDLLYWTPRGRHEKAVEGWIYKSAEELEEETGLAYQEQYRARLELVEMKVIETQYERAEHRLFMRVDIAQLTRLTACGKACAKEEEHLSNCKVPPINLEGATYQNDGSYKEQRPLHILPPKSARAEWQDQLVEIAAKKALPS